MDILAAARASSGSLLTYILAGALIFGFGYARAVWVRAREDYTKTKAAVKPLRKAMWSSIFKALKFGVVVVLVGVALVAWAVRDSKNEEPATTPARVTSPAPART